MIRGRETVTIIRREYGADDEYGQPTSTVTRIPVGRCLVSWGATSLSESLWQTRQGTEATVLFPNGTEVEETDMFELPNGQVYEINGEPIKWIPQAGSPIKTKVLVEVKHSDG